MNDEELACALFNSALVDSERQLCPFVGVSTDRRCLHHLSEVFTEDNIKTLVFFICGCSVCCEGSNMFGARSPKGTIRWRTNVKGILQRISGEAKEKTLWTNNLSSKHFKDHFGDAVRTDPFLQQGKFEWYRRLRKNCQRDQASYCPEDIVRGAQCVHDEHTVCSQCQIPTCDECWTILEQRKDSKSSMQRQLCWICP